MGVGGEWEGGDGEDCRGAEEVEGGREARHGASPFVLWVVRRRRGTCVSGGRGGVLAGEGGSWNGL